MAPAQATSSSSKVNCLVVMLSPSPSLSTQDIRILYERRASTARKLSAQTLPFWGLCPVLCIERILATQPVKHSNCKGLVDVQIAGQAPTQRWNGLAGG